MKTVRFKNKDGIISDIPAAELSPSCVYVREEVSGETYWTDSSGLSTAGSTLHPPFPEPVVGFINEFCEKVQDVFPQTPQEWIDNFRKDSQPWKEIAVWMAISSSFAHAAAGRSLPERKELFGAILRYSCSGDAAAAVAAGGGAATKLDMLRAISLYVEYRRRMASDGIDDELKLRLKGGQ